MRMSHLQKPPVEVRLSSFATLDGDDSLHLGCTSVQCNVTQECHSGHSEQNQQRIAFTFAIRYLGGAGQPVC
jgi:hypothetical protein